MPPPVAKVSELPIWVAVAALSKNVAALLLIVVIPAYWEFIKLFNVFIFPCKEVSQNIFPKGIFYEDFFPIKDNGLSMIEKVIEKINKIATEEKYEVITTK